MVNFLNIPHCLKKVRVCFSAELCTYTHTHIGTQCWALV